MIQDISIKYLSKAEDLAAIEKAWLDFARLGGNLLETDYRYFKYRLSENLFNGDAVIICQNQNGDPLIICAGAVADITYSPSIGYLRLGFIKFHKKCYHIFPYSIMGDIECEQTIQKFIRNLIPTLKAHNINYVFFSTLKRDSILSHSLLNLGMFIKDPLPLFDQHYILRIPRDLNEYLQTKDAKGRYNLKRIMSQIEENFKDVRVKVFTSEKDLEIFSEHAEIIAQKSQPRAMKVGFTLNPKDNKRRKWLAENGYFRSYILYIDEKPSAFINGTNYCRRFYTEDIGFDLTYEKYSIGSFLRLKVIEDIALTHCADVIDYGYGSDDYKKRFSSMQIEEIRIKMYVPDLSNAIFLTNLMVFNFINSLIRTTLKVSGLYSLIKRFYRIIKRKKVLRS